MRLITQAPKRTLNKAFLKQRPLRSQMDLFKTELITLLGRIDSNETEEFHKNLVSDFLKKAIYQDNNFINTKGRQDLVIHNGKDNKTQVGVIIEAKRPSNKADWFTADKPNGKAIHELVLYYLRERIECNNIDIKYLVATNINEWYIIEAKYFENLIYKNKALVKHYEEWRDGKKVTKDTGLFYNEIAKPFIDQLDEEIPCTYFNIQNYVKVLKNEDKEDDKNLIALLKILSPQHLLKVPFANDSNELDDKFYKELLHIIGLEEAKEGGKNIIRRKLENINPASFLEMAIKKLQTKGIHKVHDLKAFGETSDEQHFNIALELCITWINRILFLKLLEGQLINYHKGDKLYRFLNTQTIHDFDELFKLFHNVLAVSIKDREKEIQEKYKLVPYLNSSLFEISELEDLTICIDSLDNSETLDFNNTTILKEHKKKNDKLKTLDYLFNFLDSYDFASEGSENIQEDNKPLINASVLGKVFEKINGYKDGSIYTPGFITMYMCRQSIRLAVVQRFNERKNWDIKSFEEIYNKIDDINEANKIINDIKICDPAVGSGHFLVSALNEIIAVKSELKILSDAKGKRLKEYTVEVENDELYVTDEEGEIFEYKPQNKESQRIQETLFLEKQTIIENCLFGIDINPNSVKICRLRLWIELLKNAYYKVDSNYTELETLPNIDINIKCGNSLLSRFNLKADVFERIPNFKKKLNDYKFWVNQYKNAKDRSLKKQLTENIRIFTAEFKKRDPKIVKLQKDLEKKSNEFYEKFVAQKLFAETADPKILKQKETLETEIERLTNSIKLLHSDNTYKNAFEWRFEFPEVLDNDGVFDGFDLIIGNPPYFSISKDQSLKVLQSEYETFDSTGDIYCLFYEKGNLLLKNNGVLFFITSNKWMRASYGQKLRHFFIHQTNPIFLFDFSWFQVFENASVDSNLLGYTKGANQNKVFAGVAEKDFKISDFAHYLETKSVFTSFPDNDYWTIKDEIYTALKNKIANLGKPLSEWDLKINYGIKTGFNDAFIIDEVTKNELISEDKKNSEIIKPLIRGRDVERYHYNLENIYLINSHNGVKELGIKPVNVPVEYPIIYEHLLKFKDKAEVRADKGDNWYNLRNCAYLLEFEKEKLIWAETMRIHKTGDRNFPRFGYDNKGTYADKTVFIGVGSHLKYLLAFLNSSLGKWLIMEYVTKLDTGGYMMQKIFLDKIPVIEASIIDETKIIELVEKIINPEKYKSDIVVLEKQIDNIIYKLYDLTEEEILIIENK